MLADLVVAPRAMLAVVDDLALSPMDVKSALAAIVATRGLSPREAQVLAAAVYGVPRSRLAEALGVAENTVKMFIKNMLVKLGQPALDDAVWWVRQQIAAPATNRRRRRRPRSRGVPADAAPSIDRADDAAHLDTKAGIAEETSAT